MKHLHKFAAAMTFLWAVTVTSGCMSTTPTVAATPVDDVTATGFTIEEQHRLKATQEQSHREALALIEQGHDEQGLALLVQLTEEAPDFVAARVDLGRAYLKAGKYRMAEQALTTAVQLNPQHIVAWNELGIVQRTQGQFDAARASYEAALAIFPDFHYAQRNLAVLCELYLRDEECARHYYQSYLASGIDDPEAAMWMKALLLRAGMEEQ